MNKLSLPKSISELLYKGTVIPAHPLALTADLKIDEQSQRPLRLLGCIFAFPAFAAVVCVSQTTAVVSTLAVVSAHKKFHHE